MEETLIKQIEGVIRGIRFGTKTPETGDAASKFARLKPLNEGMYQELLGKYKIAVDEYKNKVK